MKGLSTIMKQCVYSIGLIVLSSCSAWSPSNETIEVLNKVPDDKLYARFFGTSTLYISDGTTSIMIDGFFTRRGYISTLFNRMKSSEELVIKTLRNANLDTVDILLVGHSHYDHALDSEKVAEKTNATLMGSKRTLLLAPKAKSQVIDTEKIISKGQFQISFFETPHIKKGNFISLLEQFILWTTGGLRFEDKAEVYSFFLQHPKGNILVVPSSGFTSGIKLPQKADVVFLSVGLLGHQSEQYIKEYWQQAVVETGARWVIPIHWDNFSKPLANPLKPTPYPIDDLEKTMQILNNLASQTIIDDLAVKISFPPAIEPFLLTEIDYIHH
jgi:L-ascorbate metabolism protein UlaG (beta-lactamase superfamily)